MTRRSRFHTLRIAACMAVLSAVVALVVVGIGEASAQARKRRGERMTFDRRPLVRLADALSETPAGYVKPAGAVAPAIVVVTR